MGPELARFVRQKTVLLTSHRRNGEAVGTPVHLAVDGDHAYFRTFGRAGKVKRLRNDPRVEIAPSTLGGKPTGPEVRARVRLLEQGSPENRRAAKLIARKYPLGQGILVPLTHKLRRDATLHYELRLLQDKEDEPSQERSA